MSSRRRLERLLHAKFRAAGMQIEQAKQTFATTKRAAEADLPTDENGNARIVCRRYAERRSVGLDASGRPPCFDPTSQDCQGCVEDIQEETIETWNPAGGDLYRR
ncbi:DUF7091 family protein [Halocatena halophila]|uniref:DUF7091 family protein n=1 Tax=Halocatena halophila TaxID=2814576 RepID=UPI002ED26612